MGETPEKLIPCKKWLPQGCYVISYAHNNNQFAKDVMKEVISYNELTEEDVREFTYTNEMLAFFASEEGKNRTQTGL